MKFKYDQVHSTQHGKKKSMTNPVRNRCGVDCGRQGRGQEPRVRLEEGLVLGRLVHERDDDNPEQDDRKNCTQNKAELKRNCLRR